MRFSIPFFTRLGICSVLLVTASCTTEKQKALEFNNKLAAHNQKLERMGFSWGQRFGIAMQTSNYASLRGSADSLGSQIDGMIADVTGLEAVAGGEALKQAELNYLRFERDGFLTVAKRFEALTSETPRDSVQAAIDALTAMGEEETRNLAILKGLQSQFAGKYSLTIAPDAKSR